MTFQNLQTLNNFIISLNAFQLQRTLSDPPGEPNDNAKKLWEYLVKLGEYSLEFSGLKTLKSNLICYEGDVYNSTREQGRKTEWLTDTGLLNLGTISTLGNFSIKGELQPFLYNDTYVADLTLSPESQDTTISVEQLKYFKPDCLVPSYSDASLGKTIWIYGEVFDKKDEGCEQIALSYAQEFASLAGLRPPTFFKQKQDYLLKSLLFEYEAINYNELQNSVDKCRIIILINNIKSNTLELYNKVYDWLLYLLFCYHKINYLYHQSRSCYPAARKFYSDLNESIKKFNELIKNKDYDEKSLKDFQELLKEMSSNVIEYTRCLKDLKDHYTAININIENYRMCLEKIKTISECECPELWKYFLHQTCTRWHQHIQSEIDYLSPGQDLFKQMVDTIRGIVAIEQTNIAIEQAKKDSDAVNARANFATEQGDRDRATQTILKRNEQELQTRIATIGFGIGATSVGASTSVYLIPPPQQKKDILFPLTLGAEQPHPVVYSLSFSIVCGLLGYIFGKMVDNIYSRSIQQREFISFFNYVQKDEKLLKKFMTLYNKYLQKDKRILDKYEEMIYLAAECGFPLKPRAIKPGLAQVTKILIAILNEL